MSCNKYTEKIYPRLISSSPISIYKQRSTLCERSKALSLRRARCLTGKSQYALFIKGRPMGGSKHHSPPSPPLPICHNLKPDIPSPTPHSLNPACIQPPLQVLTLTHIKKIQIPTPFHHSLYPRPCNPHTPSNRQLLQLQQM